MKPILGFEEMYTISLSGEVISLRSGRSLTPFLTNSGYKSVKFSIYGKTYHRYIHRLLAQAFLPPTEGRDVVNHIDGNKINNKIENLEWVTRSENSRHAYRTGLMIAHPQIGSKHGESKLFESDIPEIRTLYDSGFSLSEIANKYNVTKGTIWKIYHGHSWRHVNG